MARLPIPGEDRGTWGDILNEYLSESHQSNGKLKTGVVASPQIDDAAVSTAKLADGAISTEKVADGTITRAKLSDVGTAGGVAAIDGDGDVTDASGEKLLSAATANAAFLTRAATSVILFGTSIEAQNGLGPEALNPATNTAIAQRGWYHWANAFLGDRLTLVRNAGVGGNTYGQMLARIHADVLAYPSSWVFMGGPVNDFAQGRSFVDVQADAIAIFNILQAAGRRIFVLTTQPQMNFNTAAELRAVAQYNRWLADLPFSRPGLVVADVARPMMDPATGLAFAGLTVDGVHPSLAGAMKIGRAASLALSAVIPPRAQFSSWGDDGRSVLANPNFLTNGVGWSAVGTGTSVVYSADPETNCNMATVTVAGGTGGSNGVEFLENISGGRFGVGDVVQATVRIRWASPPTLVGTSAAYGPRLRLRSRLTAGAFADEHLVPTGASSENLIPSWLPPAGEVVLRSPRITIDSGVDRMYLAAFFTGITAGVFEVHDVTFAKV